ncbi:MAG: RNA methyltransferase substrate-binding domain-containing protein, partial [Christensenellaceae bacterium]
MDRVITAVQNERIKQLRQLNQKKGRREQGLFLAEGPHLVEEAVKSGAAIALMVVEEGREASFAALLQGVEPERLMRVSRPVMEAISETRTPQG